MNSTPSVDSDGQMPNCGGSGSGSGSETPPSDSMQSGSYMQQDACRSQICFDFTKVRAAR